jgi:hypothetical protein
MSLYLTAVANVLSRSDPTVARAYRTMQDERALYDAVRAAGAPKSVINAQRKAFRHAESAYSLARHEYRERAIRRSMPAPTHCVVCSLPIQPGENPCRACGNNPQSWLVFRERPRSR